MKVRSDTINCRSAPSLSQRADLDRPHGKASRRSAPNGRISHDAVAGAEALFGMGPALQDQLALRGSDWAD
jgi:hypothetical protein